MPAGKGWKGVCDGGGGGGEALHKTTHTRNTNKEETKF